MDDRAPFRWIKTRRSTKVLETPGVYEFRKDRG